MESLKEFHCLYQYYYETWNSYLNVCLLKIVVLLSISAVACKFSEKLL